MEFRLMHGDSLLGVLKLRNIDQPFFFCEFEPTEAFGEFKSIFDEELALLEADDMEAWDEAYNKVDALGLTLFKTDGATNITEFILHIKDDEAWFRY